MRKEFLYDRKVSGNIVFDSQSGQETLVPAGGDDIFIQKLDKDGDLLWLKAMGGQEEMLGHDITLDKLGNIYTTGTFSETVDFDPNDGVSEQTSVGAGDIFIQKLDNDGQLLFIETIGAEKSEVGLAISVDGSGNIYTTGSFRSKVDFNPDPDTTHVLEGGTSGNVFVLKLTEKDFIQAEIPKVMFFQIPIMESSILNFLKVSQMLMLGLLMREGEWYIGEK